MRVMTVLSESLVIAFGVFLTALAALSAVESQLAERFLKSFASSARASPFLWLLSGSGCHETVTASAVKSGRTSDVTTLACSHRSGSIQP
jgi:hypothetical protein